MEKERQKNSGEETGQKKKWRRENCEKEVREEKKRKKVNKRVWKEEKI